MWWTRYLERSGSGAKFKASVYWTRTSTSISRSRSPAAAHRWRRAASGNPLLLKTEGRTNADRVLHFVPGQEPYRIVREIRDRLVPGSHIVISHGLRTPQTTRAAAKYQAADAEVRTREQISALFNGLELIEPGLVHLTDWRPDTPAPNTEPPPFLCVSGCWARRTRRRRHDPVR